MSENVPLQLERVCSSSLPWRVPSIFLSSQSDQMPLAYSRHYHKLLTPTRVIIETSSVSYAKEASASNFLHILVIEDIFLL